MFSEYVKAAVGLVIRVVCCVVAGSQVADCQIVRRCSFEYEIISIGNQDDATTFILHHRSADLCTKVLEYSVLMFSQMKHVLVEY